MAEETPILKCKILQHGCPEHYETMVDAATNVRHVIVKPLSSDMPSKTKPNRSYYRVLVVTGSASGARSKNSFSMELTGENVKTKSIDLNFSTIGVFFKEIYDEYLIECEGDLGEVQVVSIRNTGLGIMNVGARWYLDFIQVLNLTTNFVQTFPFYHWIGKSAIFTNTANTSTLKQVECSPTLVEQRIKQLEQKRKVYIWNFYPDVGFPSSMSLDSKQHRDEDFDRSKLLNIVRVGANGILHGLHSDVLSILKVTKIMKDHSSMKTLYDAEKIAKSICGALAQSRENYDPDIHELTINACEIHRWTNDSYFGRQILNGVNCVIVKICTKLPENFPVTGKMVDHLLCRGLTLEQEMQEHNVYICDLSEIMDGLLCKEDTYCAAPLCLLYVTPAKRTIPIAIQLKRIPAENNPIFLPTDSWFDWLLAKIHFSSASVQHHQICSHYIPCHAAMEAYNIATMRTIPDAHPLYKLLRPAFRYTIPINALARKSLLNDGGIIDLLFSISKNQLSERCNERYNVHWSNIKRNLKERGVDNPDKLPNYFYRDDGVRLWDAIEAYVRSILDLFYTDDKEVQEDREIRDWANEIHNYAFPAFHGGLMGRGFPQQINTKDELIEYCTLILFTGSVQHSAVNFGQLQFLAFSPNAPARMRRPPPTQKCLTTYNDILETLPTMSNIALSVFTAHGLSSYSPDDVIFRIPLNSFLLFTDHSISVDPSSYLNTKRIYLGGFPTMWYTGVNEKACVTAFQESLAVINADIIERNKKLEIPYKYLMPQRCPNSIAI